MYKTLMALTLGASALLLPATAWAYIGPGSGAALLSSLWGVLVALAVAVAVVLFWPLRLAYRKLRGSKPAKANQDGAENSTGSAAE